MKGLNIKKVAAIGIGAALIGSALAPVALAANMVPNGLSGLAKDDIVSSTGVPVVDVVVGSSAAVSDVVWAGNIAARVAQLATVGGEGQAANAMVDVTVGGTTVVSGQGVNRKENLDLSSTGVEFYPTSMQIKKGTVPLLAEELTWEYKFMDDTNTIAVKETVDANVDAVYQHRANGVFPGEIVADIAQGKIVYRLDLGNGIPLNFKDDSNNQIDIKIPMLGTEYEVREVNAAGSTIILEKSTAATRVDEGSTVTVNGIGAYSGKQLQLVLVAVETPGTGSQQFESTWELRDGSTVVSQQTKVQSGTDLKASFNSYIDSTVYVSALVESSGQRYARITAGQDRLEIRDSREFPYDAARTGSDPIKWRANTTVSGGMLTAITIINNDLTYRANDAASTNLQGSGTDKFRMGPLPVGGEVDVLDQGKVKLVFQGLENKPAFEQVIGGENLQIRIDDAVRQIPLVIGPFGDGTRSVNIAGKEFSLDVNATHFTYWDSKITSSASQAYASGTAEPIVGRNVTASTLDFATAISGLPTVSYYGLDNNVSGDYWLVLAAQSFTVDVDSSTAVTLDFNGTWAYQDDGNVLNANFYLPGLPEIADITNLVDDLNIQTNDYKPGSSKNQYQALFELSQPSDDSIRIILDTATSNLANVNADNVTKVLDSNGQVYYDNWPYLDATATTAAFRRLSGTTEYGTEVSIDNGVAKVVIPSDRRQVQAFLGSFDTTSTTTGGTSFTNLAVNAPQTKSGVTVTVDAIDGVISGDGVAIVKSGDLVRTDAQSGKARSIIVGGFIVNAAARNLEVTNGNTLENLLVNSGDYVAAVLTSGNVVVAGYTASDTASAATELINALDALI